MIDIAKAVSGLATPAKGKSSKAVKFLGKKAAKSSKAAPIVAKGK